MMSKQKELLSPTEIAKLRKLKEAKRFNIKECAINQDDLAWITAKLLSLNNFAIKLVKKVEDTPVFTDDREAQMLKIKLTASDRMHKTLEKALDQALKDKTK